MGVETEPEPFKDAQREADRSAHSHSARVLTGAAALLDGNNNTIIHCKGRRGFAAKQARRYSIPVPRIVDADGRSY